LDLQNQQVAMGPRTHDVLWIFHDNGEPVPGDGHAKAFERIAMNAEIMDLGVPDLPKTYDFVISLAALFALSLNRPTESTPTRSMLTMVCTLQKSAPICDLDQIAHSEPE